MMLSTKKLLLLLLPIVLASCASAPQVTYKPPQIPPLPAQIQKQPANLTEEQVLAWCWASGVDKDATEAALAAQIEAQKNPVQAAGVPW